MKPAGGAGRHSEFLNPEQFLNQARAYNEGLDQSMSDRFYRFLANMGATHPFAVERARMLDEWVGTLEYTAILAGNYSGIALPVIAELCFNPACLQSLLPNAMFCGACGAPLRSHRKS